MDTINTRCSIHKERNRLGETQGSPIQTLRTGYTHTYSFMHALCREALWNAVNTLLLYLILNKQC